MYAKHYDFRREHFDSTAPLSIGEYVRRLNALDCARRLCPTQLLWCHAGTVSCSVSSVRGVRKVAFTYKACAMHAKHYDFRREHVDSTAPIRIGEYVRRF